jgi:transcriptional regulator EpsA
MNPSKPFVRLDGQDLEHLIITIEAALKVQTPEEFFLWSQGALQGFIPHEVLWCAHGNFERTRMRYESFSRALPCSRTDTQVTDPANGLMPRLVDDWLSGGRAPRLISHDGPNQAGRRQLLADLKRCGYPHVVSHGVKEMQGDHASFFVFAGLERPPGPRDAYLIELLMPHMHLALYRVLASAQEDKPAAAAPKRDALLSKREIQVLHWVKNGKTNPEIGQILGISLPTVKNHLQKVMRKLNVNNRAQAVGRSATLRLVSTSDSSA